jgi:phosphatidate cytidylyltransferase
MLSGLMLNGYLFLILCAVIMIGCLLEFFKLTYKINPNVGVTKYIHAILYIVVPVILFAGLGFPNDEPKYIKNHDPVFPCIIIFSIWINDTMAYIVGSLIGKTPLSKISPKKTWEGTIGGILLSVITMTTIAWFYTKMIYWVDMFFISLICAVFGTLGDLYESKLKRMAGVKDSGNILPGHGGMLDRFDSLLFAAPAVWLYVYLIMYH